jgi:hypothetical protein
MSIENVKVQFIRPKGYQNLQAWIADKNNVYIGRAGVIFIDNQRFPKEPSPFCNPYKIGKDGTRADVLHKYTTFITNKIEQSSEFKNNLLALQGKHLGCWCHPEPCHGDILLALLKKM